MKKIVYCLILFLTASILSAQNRSFVNSCAVEDCHENMIKKSIIHAPVGDGCNTCHEKNEREHPDADGAEFSLIDSIADLCESCHEKTITKQFVHSPYSEGSCVSCHSPHSSDIASLMKGANQRETCEECHDLDIAGNNFGHGPFMSNQCFSCHVGHQSNFESLVIDKEPDLCFQCHTEKVEDLEQANVHKAFKDGCLDCHSPHTSPAENMLLSNDNELCYKCHQNVKANVAAAEVIHEPLVQQGQCAACHSPHAGELSNLLLNEQPDLCFKCHSENTKNKEKYIDILARMNKKYLHEPLSGGQCDDCHAMHVSDYDHLLIAAFPKGNYTKPKIESFELCFQCHDSEKITIKNSKTATNFRDGSNNLHYVHVMKKKSISCQSCHDMHGANNEHIIGNVVYFGKWEMPIGYKVTETGGSCLPGCHVEYSYDREKD